MTNKESNTEKAIKGMSSQTLVTIVLGVVEIISFSIMSRLLSQEDFGYYAAINAITVIFASFSETGIGSAIIQQKEIDSKFINNSFTLSFIFGFFLTLFLLCLAYPLSSMVADRSMANPLMLMSFTLLCNCLTSVNVSIMYRRLEFLKVGLINLISLVITTLVAIVLALKGLGYYAIIAKAVLASFFTLFFSWIFAKTHYHFEFDNKTFKNIFGFSGWLMASVIFRNLAQQLDRLLMSRLLSIQSLGAYNRPKDFINQISNKLGGIFDTALFPVLSQIQDNYDSVKNAYFRSLYLLNVASIVMVMGFVFNAELIIRVFFGTEWFSVITVFQILSVAIVFNFDGRMADCYLRSLGWTKQQFYFRLFEVITKILGLIAGYRWGIIGVALSVLITDAIMICIKHLYIGKRIGITIIESSIALLKSLRISFFIIPFMLLGMAFLPNSITGEIVQLLSFAIITLLCFLVFPFTVGEEYQKSVYPKVVKIVLRRN